MQPRQPFPSSVQNVLQPSRRIASTSSILRGVEFREYINFAAGNHAYACLYYALGLINPCGYYYCDSNEKKIEFPTLPRRVMIIKVRSSLGRQRVSGGFIFTDVLFKPLEQPSPSRSAVAAKKKYNQRLAPKLNLNKSLRHLAHPSPNFHRGEQVRNLAPIFEPGSQFEAVWF